MTRVLAILFVLHLVGVTNLARAQDQLTKDQKELMELLKEDLEKRPRVKFRRPQNIAPDKPSKFQKVAPNQDNKKLLKQIQEERERRSIKSVSYTHLTLPTILLV